MVHERFPNVQSSLTIHNKSSSLSVQNFVLYLRNKSYYQRKTLNKYWIPNSRERAPNSYGISTATGN